MISPFLLCLVHSWYHHQERIVFAIELSKLLKLSLSVLSFLVLLHSLLLFAGLVSILLPLVFAIVVASINEFCCFGVCCMKLLPCHLFRWSDFAVILLGSGS